MKNLVRQNILRVKPYTPGNRLRKSREMGLDDVIKLASNENCLGPSPKAIDAIKKHLKDINRYPDASCFYLKRKMSKFLGVKEENLIFGNGSDEVISLAIRTFVNDGDAVIIAKPTFLIYEIASQIHNGKIRFVPLTKDLKYDLRAMGEAVTKDTKMIFIANPDNPTGTYVTKKELEDFFKGLPGKLVVYLDEAYFEFADHSFKDYPNGLEYLGRPGVIVGRSFSKAYGLAGLRIGYGISDPEIISYMERVREPFNVNILAQVAALASIDDKAFLKRGLVHVAKEKEFLYKALRRMGVGYVESATNFILADIKNDCGLVFRALLEKGVIVRDMKAWGLDSFIRVTVGTRSENERFVRAIREVLKA